MKIALYIVLILFLLAFFVEYKEKPKCNKCKHKMCKGCVYTGREE